MKQTRLLAMLAHISVGITGIIVSFWLAWQCLAQLDFGYSAAYSLLNIEEHVQIFGPENRFKAGFEETSAEQQKQLFGKIVASIQHNGEGLRQIFYTTADGHRYPLLREAEAVHLQDVANLISFFDYVAWAAVGILLATVIGMKYYGHSAPTPKQLALGLGGLLSISGVVLFLMGPTATFYWLHTRIFPQDHEWFFYYQDSLMTTLMKAPDLFGFIAALWVVVALAILITSYLGLRRWLAPDRVKARA